MHEKNTHRLLNTDQNMRLNKKNSNITIYSINKLSQTASTIPSIKTQSSFITTPEYFCDEKKSIFICACNFKTEHYNSALFQTLNIHFPSTLLTSVNKRQAEFLAGRYVTQQAMLYSGYLPNDYENKAPIIKIGKNRSPVWPIGLTGSITHNNSETLCAIIPNVPESNCYIGIDVESYLTAETALNIKNIIHTIEEEALLVSQGMPAIIATTLLFSAKESLFKALHPVIGKYFGFECATLINFSKEDNRLTFKISEELVLEAKIKRAYNCKYYLRKDSLITLIHGYH